MTKIKRYVGYALVGSIVFFAWALAWAVGPKAVLAGAFCVTTSYILHWFLNFKESADVGGDHVTPEKVDAE